jgi:hypothetical protein
MRNWQVDSSMFRGGGNFQDALLLLSDASCREPGKLLKDCFSLSRAREILRLSDDIPVPMGPEAVFMKSFNDDATSGPFLRAFGVRKKCGLKSVLESFAFNCYERFVKEGCDPSFLPFINGRVGFRSKLLSKVDAFKKISAGQALGRCVVMLDAIEQAFSSPLYNVLSGATSHMRFDPQSGFRNTIVRASSDWLRFWDEVRSSKVIVELDWKKFDRERPREDLEFMIDVICSCFAPSNEIEESFLKGYKIMLHRALIERAFITDDGGVFSVDGMVPSGSLWTGWLDTALNILYLRAALLHLGFNSRNSSPKCAGDDNLTLFAIDIPDVKLNELRSILNDWFRAGIDLSDFIIHRPPFGVTKLQACFSPGTDLKLGTSKLLDRADWVPFTGNLVIDEPAGKSHRWKYVFEGKPKFLSCYWLPDGRPIRPTYLNSEKLLWPEGIHKDIYQYESAVISMVVDNPWNQHNVNHMMHRFVICQQIKRQMSLNLSAEDIMWFSKIKALDDEEIPFPMIASWRRTKGWVDMEQLPWLRGYMSDFTEFVAKVTSLYARSSSGGIDAWKFNDFMRCEADLGKGQYGNEIDVWLRFLHDNPLTKYTRATKGMSKKPKRKEDTDGPSIQAIDALETLRELLGTQYNRSIENFAMYVSDILCKLRQDRLVHAPS